MIEHGLRQSHKGSAKNENIKEHTGLDFARLVNSIEFTMN